MERWRGFGRRRFAPAKHDAPPVPQAGTARYFFILGTHIWKIIAAGLLGALVSVPLVTLPASICAVNRVCGKLVRDGNCFLWQDFWEEWKSSLFKSLPIGLLFGGGVCAGGLLLSIGLAGGQNGGVLLTAAGTLLLAVSGILGAYAFVLCAMVSLSLRAILQDALCLTLLAWKRSAAALLTQVCAIVALVLLFPPWLAPDALMIVGVLPYAIGLLVCGGALFGLRQYTLCFLLNAPIQERVIAPYEAERKDEEETAE